MLPAAADSPRPTPPPSRPLLVLVAVGALAVVVVVVLVLVAGTPWTGSHRAGNQTVCSDFPPRCKCCCSTWTAC